MAAERPHRPCEGAENVILPGWTELLADEQYQALSKTFLTSGKGRRPNLPPVTVNNKLLLQLYSLKQESGSSWEKLCSWFLGICPGIAKNRIRKLVERAVSSYIKTIGDSNRQLFLSTEFDPDFITDSLSQIGITRVNVNSPPDEYHESLILRKECVVDFHHFCIAESVSLKFMYRWLTVICHATEKLIEKEVNAVMKSFKALQKNKHRNLDKFLSFLKEEFVIPVTETETIPNSPVLKISNTPSKLSDKELKLQEKLDNYKLEVKTLRDVIRDLNNEKDILIQKFSECEMRERGAHEQVKKLKDKLGGKVSNSLKLARQRNDLLKSNQNFKKDNEILNSLLNKQCKKIKKLNKNLKSLREQSKGHNLKLVCDCENPDITPLKVKERSKNTYSASMRQTVISLMSNVGVSAENVRKCISIVSENLFDFQFKELPCPKTCLNMCDEASVICHVQTAEEILKSSDVTLHNDGTSRDQQKIVGHQVSLSNGNTLYLGFSPVACEDASTLLDITIGLFKTLAELYGDLSCMPADQILKELLDKITSSMTDRAASMKLYNSKLQEFLSQELGREVQFFFLHCNAHFLLGMSAACEKALCQLENDLVIELGAGLGRDKLSLFNRFKNDEMSATSRLIKHACELLGPRGDQKNGYRQQWLSFCEDSTIPSFRSNRFNCFYAAAAAIIFHKDKLKQFFTSGVLPDPVNQKMQSVSHDIQDFNIISLICVIALLYVKVTGPYWFLVNSKVKYFDFHLYVKKMLALFEECIEDPSVLLNPHFASVFAPEFIMNIPAIDAIHDFVSCCNDLSVVHRAIRTLCRHLVEVTKRQLADFLSEGSFSGNLSAEAVSALQHCPLTNLIGESSFGDFDFDVNKRRNCSLLNRSTIQMVKRNKTVEYLKRKSETNQLNLFSFSRKHAPVMRKRKREEESNVKIRLKEKMIENQERRIQKELKAITTNANLTALVKKHGGPCTSADDVDLLCLKLSESHSQRHILEAIKNEIRFQKSFSKTSKLNLKGNLPTLKESLKNFLRCPSLN